MRQHLDLRAMRCPLSWVKTKLTLEEVAIGGELEVVVGDEKSARDLPRAAEAAGHHVAEVEAEGAVWRILIVR